MPLYPSPTMALVLIGKATGLNIAVGATDTAVAITILAGATKYRVNNVVVVNNGARADITAATLALWTGAGGTGVDLLADTSLATIASASANTDQNAANLALVKGARTWLDLTMTILYARIGTPEGAAGTVDVYLFGLALP
jgi:hypothetical protein